MATFGSACALVGRLPLNEASQSKFLLSTLSATWPPPRERQDLPHCGQLPDVCYEVSGGWETRAARTWEIRGHNMLVATEIAADEASHRTNPTKGAGCSRKETNSVQEAAEPVALLM